MMASSFIGPIVDKIYRYHRWIGIYWRHEKQSFSWWLPVAAISYLNIILFSSMRRSHFVFGTMHLYQLRYNPRRVRASSIPHDRGPQTSRLVYPFSLDRPPVHPSMSHGVFLSFGSLAWDLCDDFSVAVFVHPFKMSRTSYEASIAVFFCIPFWLTVCTTCRPPTRSFFHS